MGPCVFDSAVQTLHDQYILDAGTANIWPDLWSLKVICRWDLWIFSLIFNTETIIKFSVSDIQNYMLDLLNHIHLHLTAVTTAATGQKEHSV